ncbi:hypothetical protein AAFN88_16895 [Pelagibius sp. CAU 1746]|uniref:hypothetical protein n=1 Tax=Pelagibius sp. CAU 1746 TaxID=3140370 RepID=UPI00325A5588
MPHLPENARLWLERAEIDYIGPFVKAWASFNAWYREASGERRDSEALRYVKDRPNPVRNSIVPLLQPVRTDGHGNVLPDTEPAQKFKLLVRDLHVCLDSFHIEILREEQVERISFRAVCLGRGVQVPQSFDAYGLRYRVEKANGRWKSTVRAVNDPADVRAEIEQDSYSVDGLQVHEQYAWISLAQRASLLNLYKRCNPRPFTDLFAGDGDCIAAGDVEFRCSDEQLFAAMIEIIYAMRNALLHGELQPHEQAFATYEPAYRIVMKFLDCLRN